MKKYITARVTGKVQGVLFRDANWYVKQMERVHDYAITPVLVNGGKFSERNRNFDHIVDE